jgi:hypothetical protein
MAQNLAVRFPAEEANENAGLMPGVSIEQK